MDTDVESELRIDFNQSELSALENHHGGPMLSAWVEIVYNLVLYGIVSALISIFGVVQNIISLVIFFRLGLFSGGGSLNLFCLSIADLGGTFTSLLTSIGSLIITADLQYLSWDPSHVFYLVAGWPSAFFTIANRLLTAYIVFERCVCVIFPFKVKTMFTHRRTLIYNALVWFFIALNMVAFYTTHQLRFEKVEGKNISKLVLTYSYNWKLVGDIVYYTNFFALSFLSVAIVFVCTIITSLRIKTSQKWRMAVSKKSTSSFPENKGKTGTPAEENKQDSSTDKELRLAKTITLIAVIFLGTYIPEMTMNVLKIIDPRIETYGRFYHLAHLIYSIAFVTNATNSSINVFVYYALNSKYREEFRRCFKLKSRESKLI